MSHISRTSDPLNEPSENSRLSAASSARALSHVTTKSSSVSIGFTLDGSKTMEMFDSNTNMTSNGDTTENNKAATDVSATDGESVGFAWSALTAQKEKDEMMKGRMLFSSFEVVVIDILYITD